MARSTLSSVITLTNETFAIVLTREKRESFLHAKETELTVSGKSRVRML